MLAPTNSVLPLDEQRGPGDDLDLENNFLDLAATVSNAQGEGTLYIDWASFDPNV